MEAEPFRATNSFNSFNASFHSQAALEVTSDLRNLSFGSQSNLPLQNEWQFWLTVNEGDKPAQSALGVISTIKLFWWFYNKLSPEDLPPKATVLLFKNGIEPSWGHPRNRRGGHFKMTCKTKGHLQKLWHDVAMVLIGEQFTFARQISGAGYSVEKGTVTFWLTDADDVEALQETRKQLVNLLPAGATISFRDHTSLLGKESAMNIGAGIFDAEQPPPPQPADNHNKLVGIAADLVPHTSRHQKSRSCPEELAEFDPDDALAPPTKRPRAFSEAAKTYQKASSELPRNRGRSCSKVLAKKRTESPVTNGMRKVLSADALDEYIPHEPIQTSIPTLRHVRSWADECNSQVSSRCVSPTGGDLSEDRQPVQFHPMCPPGQSPRTSPQRNTFYDMNGPCDYMSGNETWDQSGPPSLAHSGPTSPSGPAAQSVRFHQGSPTHTPYSTSPFSGSPPSCSPTHSPYASPQAAPFSLGSSVIPAHEPAKAHMQQGVMTNQPSIILHQSPQMHSPHPHHGVRPHQPSPASPEQLKVQLDQLMQRQLLQQQPGQQPQQLQAMRQLPAQAHPQSAVLQRSNIHGGVTMPWVVPLTMPVQQAQQQLAHHQQLQQLQQQQMQQQQQQQMQQQQLQQQQMQQHQQAQMQRAYLQYQVPQLAPAMPAVVAPTLPMNGSPKGRKVPPAQPVWDVKRVLDYLCEARGLELAPPDAEGDGEKTISKSRSPRNRRKIRERKIKEAAESAKREMYLWAPIFNTPETAWVAPVENMYLPMLPSFNEVAWFRFVQACKKDQISMTGLGQLTPDQLEKLGVEEPEQVKELSTAVPISGPMPHPLHGLWEKVKQHEMTRSTFLAAPEDLVNL